MMIQATHQRYSTKKFDPSKKISPQTLESILDTFRFSASSGNLQPRGCVVVSDQETKDLLQTHSYCQAQVGTCSHLLVLCRRTVLDGERVDGVIEATMADRSMTRESLEGLRKAQLGILAKKGDARRASEQVHIALGQLLMACSIESVDACALGGFDPQAYDDILNLSDQSLASCVVLAIGHRSPDDKYATLPKTRLPQDKVVFHHGK